MKHLLAGICTHNLCNTCLLACICTQNLWNTCMLEYALRICETIVCWHMQSLVCWHMHSELVTLVCWHMRTEFVEHLSAGICKQNLRNTCQLAYALTCLLAYVWTQNLWNTCLLAYALPQFHSPLQGLLKKYIYYAMLKRQWNEFFSFRL